MADFQSFLFRSMHSIGLADDDRRDTSLPPFDNESHPTTPRKKAEAEIISHKKDTRELGSSMKSVENLRAQLNLNINKSSNYIKTARVRDDEYNLSSPEVVRRCKPSSTTLTDCKLSHVMVERRTIEDDDLDDDSILMSSNSSNSSSSDEDNDDELNEEEEVEEEDEEETVEYINDLFERIPWSHLADKSRDILMKTTRDEEPIFTKSGHKVRANQVRTWLNVIGKFKSNQQKQQQQMTNNVNNNSNNNNTKSKEYFVQKKRQLMSKVANGCSELSKKSSRLYSNLMSTGGEMWNKNKSSSSRAKPTKSNKERSNSGSSERNYINDDFSDKIHGFSHLYNEINEQRAAANNKSKSKPKPQPSSRLPEFSELVCKALNDNNNNNGKNITKERTKTTTSNMNNNATSAEIKHVKPSPEKKLLYNEWFAIIKRMENDPKFDLEAMIRARAGRTTTQAHTSSNSARMKSLSMNNTQVSSLSFKLVQVCIIS